MPEHHTCRAPDRHAGTAIGRARPAIPRRLLVVMPSWVGDCVMAMPLLRAIRAHGPESGRATHIAAYLRPPLVPLFEPGDLFDECLGSRPRGVLGPNREARRLRPAGFDAALLLPNSFRAAWTTWLARIPRRIGYDRDRRGWLLSDRVPCPAPGGWHTPIPLIHYYLGLAAPLGVAPPADSSPRLVVAQAETTRARELLAERGFTFERPIALLNPGASKPGKRWPPECYAALADRLHQSHGVQIVVNGSAAEAELTRNITGRVRHAATLDLAPHATTLATLAAMCSLVDLVVTNDTGTRHVAAAVGFEQLRRKEPAPGIVTIFGTVPPEWTTLGYARETELFDRATGRVDGISLDQVSDACRASIAHAG